MKLLDHSKVTISEEPDQLDFVVSIENGWLSLILGPIFLLGWFAWTWSAGAYVLIAMAAIILLASLANLRPGPVTRISISAKQITVNGSANTLFSARRPTELRIQAYEIKNLSYFVGDEGEPSGLYLNRTTHLLSLDERATNLILVATRRKFPLLKNPEHTPTSLLHGDDSGITVLGISNKAPEIQPSTHTQN